MYYESGDLSDRIHFNNGLYMIPFNIRISFFFSIFLNFLVVHHHYYLLIMYTHNRVRVDLLIAS